MKSWLRLLLLTLVAVAFARVVTCGYVLLDDGTYVTSNPHVLGGLTKDGVAWALTTGAAGNWHPLTWASHMIDVSLWGTGPLGPHLMNVALHLLAVLFFLLFLETATGEVWPSLLAAALFALHPLRVESVAWIAERKDVLSTALGMATLWTWARWTRGPSGPRYLLTLALFTLGLLAKPMLVTLPLLLLVLDFWPFERRHLGLRARLVEKTPFLAVAAASSVVTYLVQRAGGSVTGFATLPLERRAANAVVSVVLYLGKLVWPVDLAVLYPHPVEIPAGRVVAALLVVAGATWAAVALRRTRPYVLTGWLWFLGTLVPVSGIVQIGVQAMADRYVYLPSAGLTIAVAFLASDLVANRAALRRAAAVASVLVVAILATLTWRQIGVWRTTETLFAHAVKATGPNAIARVNYGLALADRGDVAAAEVQFSEAVKIWPEYGTARHDLGLALLMRGDIEGAVAHLAEARRLDPDEPTIALTFARALAAAGRTSEARQQLQDALRMRPGWEAAREEFERLPRGASGIEPEAPGDERRRQAPAPSSFP